MRRQSASQVPASSYSIPAQSLPHPAGLNSVTDVSITENMHVCSPFENTVVSPPSAAHSMHPLTDRRPPLKVPHPSEVLKCPRCDSLDTKFCYYNNYSLTQPRYFCKNCKRYWTAGGALRNVPVGGGLRKNKRSKLKLAAEAEAAISAATATAATSAGQYHYQGQALTAPTTNQPVAEAFQRIENRAAATGGPAPALPSGNIYAKCPGASALISDPSSGDEKRSSGAATSQDERTAGNLLQRYSKNDHQQAVGSFYSVQPARAQVPQFYEEYRPDSMSINVGHGHHEFRNVGEEYMVNYNFIEDVANTNNGGDEPISASNNNGGGSKDEYQTAQEKVEGVGGGDRSANNSSRNYDSWQLLSEGLIFNGVGDNGADGHGNLFYMPSTSWPDFSHFNDNAGTG